jgi:hypothetical protein
MKHRAFAAVIVASLSMTAAPVLAQQGRDRNDGRDNRDTDRVCFYRDVEYQGPSWCYRPGDELADLRNRNNEISSIRIFGRARVVVWDQEEFMGATDEFDMDVPDLRLRAMEGRRNWNDRIDSFQVMSFNRRGRGFSATSVAMIATTIATTVRRVTVSASMKTSTTAAARSAGTPTKKSAI